MTQRFHVTAGKALTVTASATSTGLLRRLESSGAAAQYAASEIAADTTTVIGPFGHSRNYELESLTGAVTYSIADAEALETSADIASAMTDETGTGAAVFGTGPTVTGAIITRKVTTVSDDGAVTIAPGVVKITKSASEAALTLATTATDGVEILFVSTTAKAHTIAATIQDGVTGGDKTTATFAAFAGACITLVSAGSKWSVASSNNVTIS